MRLSVLTFLLLSVVSARSELLRNGFEGARPTGMGNAFIALADDANALFYNPAGLARIKGAHFHLFNIIHGSDSSDSSSRLYNALFKGEFDKFLRQDTQYVRYGFMPTLVLPNFAVSFFNHGQGFFDIQNLSASGVDVYAHNDIGIQAGFSIPFGDYFSIGVAGKVIERTGVDVSMTPAQIVDLAGTDPVNFLNNLYDRLKSLAGTGYGFGANAGVLMRIPTMDKNMRFTLAATADDIGDVTFQKIGDTATPPSIKHSYNFGAAIQYTLSKSAVWNTTLDMRNQMSDVPLIKQVHFGTEIRHKVFGIRGGVSQGYLTGGLSIEFPPHTRLHFSTYASELGTAIWQRQQRWYLVQLTIGFNPL